MPQGRRAARRPFAAIEARRGRNMRQLLLRASRIVNRHVVEGLRTRGYADLRSTHTTLLSNIDLAGGTATEVAERAGITKQAIGRLAAELEQAGFLRVESDPRDRRVKVLRLTDRGHQLMMDSFEVMANLERRYTRALGRLQLAQLRAGLTSFIDEFEQERRRSRGNPD